MGTSTCAGRDDVEVHAQASLALERELDTVDALVA